MPGGKLQERRASRFSFFVYMTTRNGDPRARSRAWVFAFTEKMYRYTSPRQGSLDKQSLSSELDKLFISRHIRHLKYVQIKKGGDAYVLHNENRKT